MFRRLKKHPTESLPATHGRLSYNQFAGCGNSGYPRMCLHTCPLGRHYSQNMFRTQNTSAVKSIKTFLCTENYRVNTLGV